jgi:hypothetical protein
VAEAYARVLSDASFEAPIDLAMIDRLLTEVGSGVRILDAGRRQSRVSSRAYGHDVEFWSYLHGPSAVWDALTTAGFVVDTRLERAPRPSERHSQAFELATWPPAVAVPPA